MMNWASTAATISRPPPVAATFRRFRGDDRIAGRTEEEVYEQVGLPDIPPELREARGEIEAAQQDTLPHLITRDDLRGDLHCHTKASDGRHTIQEMAEAAKQRGYEYLAITEHSKRLTVTHGLDEKRLRHQMQEIDKVNESLSGIRLLKGIECDILEDGSLDLADDVLAELDLDLDDTHCKLAKDMGVKLALSTDAHTTISLAYIRYGVDQARRGWLVPDDVINTPTWGELKRRAQKWGQENPTTRRVGPGTGHLSEGIPL